MSWKIPVIFGLKTLDWLTTVEGMEKEVAVEMNPLAKKILEQKHGNVLLLLLGYVVAGVPVGYLELVDLPKDVYEQTYNVLLVLFSIPVIWNILQMIKVRRYYGF